MSLLKFEPDASLPSLETLLVIAAALEQEAANRYAELASRMRSEGNASLAEVFEHLSAEERSHLDGVVNWSKKALAHVPDPARVQWEHPDTFDDEGISIVDGRLLSAYRALSMAVRNEERAFAFWSYVAAHAQSDDVRKAAESMAHEELGHVATLRRERRNAFHAERDRGESAGDDTEASFDFASLERRLADMLDRLALQAAPQDGARLKRFAEEARRNADALEREPVANGASLRRRGADDPRLIAEFLVERYLAAADDVDDEATLARIQKLAACAIARLAWLRADLPELGSK